MVFGPAGNRRLGFLIHGFWAGRKSSTFGVWAAPAAPKAIPEGGGLRPPFFGTFFGAAGAAPTPQIDDFRPAQKPCIQNPSVSSCLAQGIQGTWPAMVQLVSTPDHDECPGSYLRFKRSVRFCYYVTQ